jgi:lipoprotein NlpD
MVSNQLNKYIALCLAVSLTGCMTGGYAPVVRIGTAPKRAPQTYRVRSGDTLYSVAWQYGLDYHQIARRNQLNTQYAIYPGQLLHFDMQEVKRHVPNAKPLHGRWLRPTQGSIIQTFKPGYAGNAGIDIAGHVGQPILATRSGTVVYSGQGVRGYGNLIIMSHSDHFLSAYAFNQSIQVRVGQHVKQGQLIAKMGRNNSDRAVLHFEIRRDGQPVNPLNYLK